MVRARVIIRIGAIVRVIYPDYAAGMLGRIQSQEPSGRWIIKIEDHFLPNPEETMILSLNESDFEVITNDEFR